MVSAKISSVAIEAGSIATIRLCQLSVGALKGATHGRFAGGNFWFLGRLAPFGGQLCYSLSVTDPVGALAPFETFSRELSR